MVEFNPDGSIKLPGALAEKKNRDSERMLHQSAFRVRKEVKYDKTCDITIISSALLRISVEDMFRNFNCVTPMKFTKVSDKECVINIGRDFNRCRECSKFIERLRDVVDGNVIVEKGACTYGENLNRNNFYDDF